MAAASKLKVRPTIVYELPDHRAFLSAYFHQGELGSVFVPGDSKVRAGEHVDLELRFVAEDRTVRLTGILRWKRSTPGPKLPAGVAIELMPNERHIRDTLIDFANGREVKWIERSSERLPVHMVIEYASSSVFLSDFTDDLSDGGAFIVTDELLPIGTELRLKLKPPGELFALRLKGKVAWQQLEGRRGIGVTFEFEGDRTKDKIHKLCGELRKQVHREFELHSAAK